MLKLPIVAVLCCFATSGLASNKQNYQVASDLGMLLTSETLCDLSFNHDAIEAYVDASVDHTDMGFAKELTGQLALARLTLRDMTDSALRAHCSAISATARQHSFIE